ncbi:hypothetical protein GO988_15495 [Hymenobacter sp. HMF4947]|uniref:Uncharacterized protein n=1 Tax=Hymenobacter ginkgonis TaxID=2682976 RepID=A0A7K1TH37_9BACT|nr:hypothetical protein [Hymenobacter ginkgonis]MVN77737.1 hypothetical protein [Hymenobacter ginkgonis]
MKLSDIRDWLVSGQDFTEGVALYAQVGTSKTYQRLFALGATAYSQGVLQRELAQLVEVVGEEISHLDQDLRPVPVPPAAPVMPEPVPVVPEPAPVAPVATPVHLAFNQPLEELLDAAEQYAAQLLAELSQQLRQVRDERSHLHPQLTAKGLSRKARLVLALQIVGLTSEEAKIKALQAHVRQHGKLPGPVASAQLNDQGQLRQRLQNRLSYRCKLRKKQPAKAAQLAVVEAEIVLIRSKLTS